MFIILQWTEPKSVGVVSNKLKETLLFDSYIAAESYAERNIKSGWLVVNIGDD